MNDHFVTRVRCPVCGGRKLQALFSREYTDPSLRKPLERFYAEVGQLDFDALIGAEFKVQSCADCGLLFQRDIPDDYLLGKLYEHWIDPVRARARFHSHATPARGYEMTHEVSVSLALANVHPHYSQVLDYGCGWGEWAQTARSLGAEVWGTELSASRRAACEAAGIRVLADSDLCDGHFHVINADQVFEHLPDPVTTLKFLKSKLQPGGVIRIAVPNGSRTARALDEFDGEVNRGRLGRINPIAPLEHLNCFTPQSLIRLGAECGLVRVRPNWNLLRHKFVWPPGIRAKLKHTLLPFYLRSEWTTQVWFSPAS